MSSHIIPVFSMSDYYVYFKDLMNTENNSSFVGLQKRALFHKVQDQINHITEQLTDVEKINNATKFIQQIAANERNKELLAVKNYFRKQHKKYPEFIKNKTEQDILNNPDEFYLELTKYLNYVKQSGPQYKKELQRIRENAGQIEGIIKKKNRSQYSDDNYLYNLQSDLESLLNKLNGTYYNTKENSTNAYTNKVQAAAMKILNELGITNTVASGEEFAAIAAGVLIDLQRRLQDQFDEERMTGQIEHNKKIADAMEKEIDPLVSKYIKEIENNEDLNTIQGLLKDINSPQSKYVIEQIKNGLGIKSLTTASDLLKRNDKINITSRKTKHRKHSYKQMLNNIVGNITNPNLLETLPKITFTSFDKKTGHGNIKEVVSSIIQTDKNKGLFINANVGVDIMQIQINYEIEDPTETSMMKIFSQMNKDLLQFEKETHIKDDASLRDLEPAIHSLNNALAKSEKELDDLLRAANSEEPFFIYHESLKLHSSVETGKTKGFSGRELNILNGLDTVYSVLQTNGLATPTTKEALHFLALNLAPSAAAPNETIDIVEQYLAKFIGLLMFDDAENMAKEALNEIQYTNLNKIHVYQLNNIYVHTSMLLTYISEEIQEASQFALEDIATIEINVKGAENTIINWLNDYHEGKIEYNLQEWRKVANKIASATQIKITLFAAFLQFIEQLSMR